ncbi:MAG: helix-turn-helix domain-containing protein [Actinomycetota bacterium]|nr:helix-turn-helix domain-containing protein [Actinomycetota bacterium]
MTSDADAVTDEPFPAALRALMRDAGLSFRALAAETTRRDNDGRGLTHGHLGQLACGHQHPSQRAVELLAATLGVAPEHFLEYRLAQLRHALNEREVGYDRARDTLRRFAA